MAQIIPNEYGNISGRIGKGIGKALSEGLSEQIPKEAERYRLATGLKALSQKKNLSPIEYASELAALPGVTPAHFQALPELYRQQNIREAYRRGGRGATNKESAQAMQEAQQGSQQLQDMQFANLNKNKQMKNPDIKGPSDYRSVDEFANADQRLLEKSPMREEVKTVAPYTPEEYREELGRVMDENPWLTPPEAAQQVKENESRRIAQPEYAQKEDARIKEVRREADDEFQKQMELKLQKEGKETFSDLSGEMQGNLKKKMYRDILKGSNTEKAADKWSQIAIEQAKNKKLAEVLASRPYTEYFRKEKTRDSLIQIGKAYKEAGNDEAFYNMLKTKNAPGQPGFDMSPWGAASIQYPLSKSAREAINKIPKPPTVRKFVQGVLNKESIPGMLGNFDYANNARKAAIEIENSFTGDDSLLAIAKELNEKNLNFDSHAFFKQLREDQENLPLNARQKRELIEAEPDILPRWGDLWILPFQRSIE